MSTQDVDASSSAEEGSLAYGCLFCRTGREESIASEIEAENPDVRLIFARKLRRRRQGRASVEESVPLFPGYLFFCTDEDRDMQSLSRHPDVYRLLRDSEGIWKLRGSDLALVRELFCNGGVAGFSKAYYEGDRIRIQEGLLKAYEGQIIRVNRRNQTAQIALGMGGREVTVWLGFELIERSGE